MSCDVGEATEGLENELWSYIVRDNAYNVRDNAKKFTSVGLSYKGVLLLSKIFLMFDVVCVKLNSISCEF